MAKKRDKWQAYINYSGKRISLGSFATKELAAEARQAAEQKIRERLERLLGKIENRSQQGKEQNMPVRDLFEELKEIVQCDYVSDLRYAPWLDKARRAIAGMDTSIYSLVELKDAAEYLYAEKKNFISSEAAQEYFRNRWKELL